MDFCGFTRVLRVFIKHCIDSFIAHLKQVGFVVKINKKLELKVYFIKKVKLGMH